ncbi:MAG: antitoxin VapB family protein [Nanoarchaeota archaeon]
MSKTMMISNDVYAELRKMKGEKSFSEVIRTLIRERNKPNGAELSKYAGSFKGDTEWDESKKMRDKGWKDWSKKYA